MSISNKIGTLSALCATALLVACGGGGGGGGGGVSNFSNLPDTGPRVNVSGTATFASVPNNITTGGLDYAATTQKPVRGVTIQALVGGTVVAGATTSELGTYTLSVPANSNFNLRLRAELVNTQGASSWNVAVKDNTAGSALWVVDGATASAGAADSERSISAGSGWGGASYTGARAAGPFAILDTVYSGIKLVTTAQSTAQFPPLSLYWSPNNKPINGDLTLGEIGTSFFSTTPGTLPGSVLSRFIYILGQDGNDTDEYDSTIVAHEFGHYLQSAFSTDGSLGGPHGGVDKLDATVAFSEGWGNAWSSMARANDIYTDSAGTGQLDGTAFDVSIAPIDSTRGWYREDSAQAIVYNLFKDKGFQPIWSALTGPMTTSQDALPTLFSFAAAVRTAGDAVITSALNNLLLAQSIFTGASADQWGAGETNNGGDTANLPLYSPITLGAPEQTCLSKTNLTAPFPNKLGSVRYYRLTLGASGSRTVTANFPAGQDFDFEVFQKGVLLLTADGVEPTMESASLALAIGEVIIRVIDFNLSSAPASTSCGTLTVN